MAAANFEQIPSEIEVPFEIPRMRTVAEELAACKQLFQNRESRKAIVPIYERKCNREYVEEDHANMHARPRQRQKIEKKIVAKRSPSLPPTPTVYYGQNKISPRSANMYRK